MISRRAMVMATSAAAALAAAGIGPARAQPAADRPGSPERARNVVLVHGLYADGSCWLDVIPRLQAAGLGVTAVQNPLTTLDAATAEVRRVMALQRGPTVLVGHSFAGTLISNVESPVVSALVYVAARAPDAEEDYAALAGQFAPAPASSGVVFDGDVGSLTEAAFMRDFANGLPESRARALFAVQQPFHRALTTTRTSYAAWRSRPSFYAVSAEDRTINPDLERFMARRMDAHTIEVAAGHLSMLSHPEAITALILRAGGF